MGSCTQEVISCRRGAEVPGLRLQREQATETAHRAEGAIAPQAENPGTDATDARNQAGTNAEGTDGLRKGLEELLRLLSDARGPASSGGMDTTSVAIHDLDGNAGSSGTDSYVNAGLLRHSLHKQRVGRTVHGGWRTARPCPSRFRSSASTLWVFLGCSRVLRSPLNRPMRTRMSGGAAEESERLPLCRFHEELLTLRTLFGVTVVGKACVTGCYFLAIATEARVVSQSIFSVAPFPVFANEIAKFSTGEGSVETFISIRARSLDGPA